VKEVEPLAEDLGFMFRFNTQTLPSVQTSKPLPEEVQDFFLGPKSNFLALGPGFHRAGFDFRHGVPEGEPGRFPGLERNRGLS
jgi:hypothetical protein